MRTAGKPEATCANCRKTVVWSGDRWLHLDFFALCPNARTHAVALDGSVR